MEDTQALIVRWDSLQLFKHSNFVGHKIDKNSFRQYYHHKILCKHQVFMISKKIVYVLKINLIRPVKGLDLRGSSVMGIRYVN